MKNEGSGTFATLLLKDRWDSRALAAQDWLDEKKAHREEAHRQGQTDREAKQVGLAKEANLLASDANRIATSALTAAQWSGAGAAVAAIMAGAALVRACGRL